MERDVCVTCTCTYSCLTRHSPLLRDDEKETTVVDWCLPDFRHRGEDVNTSESLPYAARHLSIEGRDFFVVVLRWRDGK